MRLSVFAYGFRPFFLLTALAAVTLVPMWVLAFVWGGGLQSAWPPTLWHAHEMLFGLISAALAGFLLTAVPSWTGQKGYSGLPLVALSALWVGARLVIVTAGAWSCWFTAAIDAAFLPAVALLISPSLLRSRNRNTVMLLWIGLLTGANVAFHVSLARKDIPQAAHALRVGIDVVLVLVTLVGGRIIPAFTNSGLREQHVHVSSSRVLTGLAVGSMTLIAIADVFLSDSPVTGVLAAVAGVLQFTRMAQWGALRTLKQPTIWILHLAYLWLPMGLLLRAWACLGGASIAAFWLHALTIGALSTMILAVMSRASLGHTGRMLEVHPLITAAYVLLTVAGIVRVFGLALHVAYPVVIVAAATAWTCAFVLFLIIYTPILVSPRVDGKAG